MADINKKYSENVPGRYFVDNTCIACDACCIAAPNHFKMHDDNGHAYLSLQPNSPEEEDLCKEAMDGCPVESIGHTGA